MPSATNATLTLRDTQVLKGVALLLLLAHHCLSASHPYDDVVVHGWSLVATLSDHAKLCVAIFVFLSGYGLTVSAERKGGIASLARFYRRRFVHLMAPYWVVWLLFVPLGVLVMGRTFTSVYVTDVVWKAVLDFMGLFCAVVRSPYGYNATWWFYSCIIPLYLFFPLLFRLRREPVLLLAIGMVSYVIGSRLPLVYAADSYTLSFIAGILIGTRPLPPPI